MKKLLLTNILMLWGLGAFAQTATDMTSYIKNPDFEDGSIGWVCKNLSPQTNSDFKEKANDVFMERWVSKGYSVGSGSISQIITGLPTGIYTLTISAQNLNQNSTSQKCSGAYVYANDQKTSIYTPDDYSVTFTTLTGKVEIGFAAENATGNWIALDNFRLSKIEDIEPEQVVAEIDNMVEEAEKLSIDKMPEKTAEFIQSAIAAGKLITTTSTDTETQMALTNLKTAIEKGNFAIELANATPGPGTAPAVTVTNHYVATGSTQALVRAAMTGSNILERGVCWSTERNPTVLDDRTTKYFSLKGYIFHIQGLKPATIYYVRPYVMNKTYTVAYGDEVKIATLPKGTCTGSWDDQAPTLAANLRCRTAIQQTIDYFNEWTGIQGFHLSGHYGADTQTADCSYGGWMRIGPNEGNQAIGTVLHETGHGVGVGQQERWRHPNPARESSYWNDYYKETLGGGKWLGREANEVLRFLENYDGKEVFFTGDGIHGWGSSSNTSITNATISYDWLVNGADKDTHQDLQYIGGMCILHGLFIDGLCPTYNDPNGIAGYTYNFDDTKKYYLMNKDAERGLGEGLLYQDSDDLIWKPALKGAVVEDNAAWYIEYNPKDGLYSFKNVSSGEYISHATGGYMEPKKMKTAPGGTEKFQLMPDRTDVTFNIDGKAKKTHGYWFVWDNSGLKSMNADDYSKRKKSGAISPAEFDYSDEATKQQWIILSEDELVDYQAKATDIIDIEYDSNMTNSKNQIVGIYSVNGVEVKELQKGLNIIQYSNGDVKKILGK